MEEYKNKNQNSGKFEMGPFLKEIEMRAGIRSRVAILADEVLHQVGNKHGLTKTDLAELHDTVVDTVAEQENTDTERLPFLQEQIIVAVEKHLGNIPGEGLTEFMREFREKFTGLVTKEDWSKVAS